MAASIINRLCTAIHRFELTIASIFVRRFPPGDAFCVAGLNFEPEQPQLKKFSLENLIGDGFLWAVPRSRRTIEKRLKRKYGDPYYGSVKLLSPKNTLRTCNVCGDDHEVGVLCPTCYKKVIDETKAMQDKIEHSLGLNPVESEVVVLYDGEKDNKPNEFFEGKRIVEMEKPRPAWFSKNLLQESTQQPSNAKDVKPTELS